MASRQPEALALVWARENGEWWPAHLLDIRDDGAALIDFVGWGARHNVWLPAPDPNAAPALLYQEKNMPPLLKRGGSDWGSCYF